MSYKIQLLEEFYSSIDKTTVKIESLNYGFRFLNMLCERVVFDYGEMMTSDVCKYRLSDISPNLYESLLKGHIEVNHNLCGYFNKKCNTVAALNLDNSLSTYTGGTTTITSKALELVTDTLSKVDIAPLITKCGRGFHLWLRFNQPQKNVLLSEFWANIISIAVKELLLQGIDSGVFFNNYPCGNEKQRSSLRLFGSKHVKTGQFSYIIHPEKGILSENDSWVYFEEYLNKQSISTEHLKQAIKEINIKLVEIPQNNNLLGCVSG